MLWPIAVAVIHIAVADLEIVPERFQNARERPQIAVVAGRIALGRSQSVPLAAEIVPIRGENAAIPLYIARCTVEKTPRSADIGSRRANHVAPAPDDASRGEQLAARETHGLRIETQTPPDGDDVASLRVQRVPLRVEIAPRRVEIAPGHVSIARVRVRALSRRVKDILHRAEIVRCRVEIVARRAHTALLRMKMRSRRAWIALRRAPVAPRRVPIGSTAPWA